MIKTVFQAEQITVILCTRSHCVVLAAGGVFEQVLDVGGVVLCYERPLTVNCFVRARLVNGNWHLTFGECVNLWQNC